MFNFLKLLNDKTTPPNLEEAISQTKSDLETARSELEGLENGWGDVLLTGEDADAEAHEEQLAKCRRQIERLEHGLEQLQDRLEEVQDEEKREQLGRRIAFAESQADRGLDLIAKYGEHAGEIKAILLELSAIDEVIKRANDAADGAGDPRRVIRPNRQARKVPDEIVEAHVKVISPRGSGDARNGGAYIKGDSEPTAHEVNVPASCTPGRERVPLQDAVELPRADHAEGMLWGKRGSSTNVHIALREQVNKRAEEILASAE